MSCQKKRRVSHHVFLATLRLVYYIKYDGQVRFISYLLLLVMIGVQKYLAVILLLIVGIVDSQLPQYGASSGGDSALGTVGSLPVNIGIGSGASRQGSGGFRGSSSSGSIGSNIGGGEGQGGARSGGEDHQGLDWLREALPGEPEIDYPIYSLPPPSSSFSCNGRVIKDNLLIDTTLNYDR